MKYTVFLGVKYSAAWLQLNRNERNNFNEKTVYPLIAKYSKSISLKFFDSEAFSTKISDFILLETTNLKDYYYFIEEFRDTDLFRKEWLKIEDIYIGIEDGFKSFEASVIEVKA